MKVALVLSGGAVRGVAHIGVIKALEDLGFEISAISGVSAGALVGAFYCAGYTPEDMLKIVKSKHWLRYIKPRLPKLGFFSLTDAKRFLKDYLEVERIEELKREFHICALDILSGNTLYFSEGELYEPLLGSCALPGIFEPVKFKNFLLLDGGITNNLPVEPVQNKGLFIVGVDVNPTSTTGKPRSLFAVLIRSFLLAVRSNADRRKELCDVVIVPDLNDHSPYNLWKLDELYHLGYKKTLEVMKDFYEQ